MNSEEEEQNQELEIKSSNELIKIIFSKEMPTPNPSFSDDFMKLVPFLTNSDYNSEDIQDLKSFFKLDLQSRLQIINFLIAEPPEIQFSDDNKKFASILCLQSCCAIFFVFDEKDCLNHLNNDIFDSLFKALILSFKTVQTNYALILQFTSIILNKLSQLFDFTNIEKLIKLINLLSTANNCISVLSNHQIEKIPIYLFISEIQIASTIIDSFNFVSTENADGDRIDHLFSLIKDYFFKVKQILIQNKKSIKNFHKIELVVTDIFQKIGQKINFINSKSKLSAIISIISFAVELSSITQVDFMQINDFIKMFFSINSNENLSSTLQFINEDKKSDPQNKIAFLKDVLSSLKPDSVSSINSLLDFKGKKEICDLFSETDSKTHLFYIIFAENSFLMQHICDFIDAWACFVLVINDFMINQSDFVDSIFQEEYKKASEILFKSLILQRYFTLSIFNDENENFLKIKILALNAYVNTLKKLKENKNNDSIIDETICIAIKNPLIDLIDHSLAENIEYFYEFFLIATNFFQNIYLFDNEWLDSKHQLLTGLKKCLQKYLDPNISSSNNMQIEILTILENLLNYEKFIAFTSNSLDSCQLYLSLLDICANTSLYTYMQKIGASLFRNIFGFASKYPELVNYETMTECIESAIYSRQIKILRILSNSLKNSIFVVTNNNYYNSHSFSNQPQTSTSSSYITSNYQSFLKKVFKSKIMKIAVDLIPKEKESIPCLLELLSLSSFIFPQSSQFTYSEPTIVKITSSMRGHPKDTFLLLNNVSVSAASYVDWGLVNERLKEARITEEIYIEVLKILSSYIMVSYPLDYREKDTIASVSGGKRKSRNRNANESIDINTSQNENTDKNENKNNDENESNNVNENNKPSENNDVSKSNNENENDIINPSENNDVSESKNIDENENGCDAAGDGGDGSLSSLFLLGVSNSSAVCLIDAVLQTEFARDFLGTLKRIVEHNLIQAIKLFKSGALLVLLDSLPSLQGNKHFSPSELSSLVRAIFEIVAYVVAFICDKETCDKFQKSFYALKSEQPQNETSFIESFKASLVPNPLSTSNFYHFNSTNSLFFLPPFPSGYFDAGITLVAELLIPSFGEISASFFDFFNASTSDDGNELVEDELFELPIFYVASENAKDGSYDYLVISLFRNKITVSSSVYEEKVDVYLDIPSNDWFTLSVSFKKWKQIKVQIIENQKNDKKKQTLKTQEIEANMIGQWSIPIHRVEMFNISFFSPPDVIKRFKSQRKIEGLIRRVMLFNGNFPFASNDDQTIVCRSQRLFGHFTPQFCSLPASRLENMVQDGLAASVFMINTEPTPLTNEQFVCPFSDFFLKFDGLIEFVLYFSKSGMNEDGVMMLFETLLFLFGKFAALEKVMYEINGFHLIAHFLNTRQQIEVNERFFDEMCLIEEKITDELLLDQFRNNMILNFQKYLELEDNELLFRVLQKWQLYDSSFFRSHTSFSKFCYILFHQFAERKDQINMIVKKALMSILVVNSRFLEKQDLYLLTQLTGKLSEYDIDSSILLIKEIYGITKDHPDKLDTIQRGLIEIKNKPPEILCTIVKLFDTDDEFAKRLLYTELNTKRTKQQRKEYVICLFNFLFNTHKKLSFEEMLQINDFHIVSFNLLLFILSFGFECDDDCVSFIVSLVGNIFTKNPESAKFIADTIGANSITLFIFISFSIFKSHSILNFVMSLIFQKLHLLADSLRIIDIISAFCRRDLSEYQSLILNTFILKTIDFCADKSAQKASEIKDANKVVNVIVNFICFGPNRSLFDTTASLSSAGTIKTEIQEEKNFSLVNFFNAYLERPIAMEKSEFGLFVKDGGCWVDLKTVELLLTLIGSTELNEESHKKLLILFGFVVNKFNHVPLPKVAEILDRINSYFGSFLFTYCGSKIVINEDKSSGVPCFDLLIPVIVSLHQNGYEKVELEETKDDQSDADNNHLKIISAFVSSFDLNLEHYERYNAIMNDFFTSLRDISDINKRILSGMTNESLNEEEKVTIDEAFADVKQKEITLKIHREKIYRNYRPVYMSPGHYRRYNMFDEFFRPFLLTSKERLKFEQIDSPVFNDNMLGSGEKSDEEIIWTLPCQRIKVDQTFDGYFSVTENGYRFITPKGKSYNLRKSSIRFVFWNYCNNEPLSFTFFLLNGKCFLFRFFKPETRISVIKKLLMVELKNCYFFQLRKGNEEAGRLQLTRRWRERSISNFDYLMWLNLLSGRTFIDPDFYPIFPLIFTSKKSPTEMRDLSKNVVFLCKGNIAKWKAVRMTYDPYDNFLLNDSFSTQKVVCTFLDGIDQFKHRRTEDTIGPHRFYSCFDDTEEQQKEKRSENVDLKSAKSTTIVERKKMKVQSVLDAANENLIKTNLDLNSFRSFGGLTDGLKGSTVHTELIPEFFFLPEVFSTSWSGEKEAFPCWAPSASQFVLANNSALEGEEVSMHLHEWINIVWGVKQNEYVYNPNIAFSSADTSFHVKGKNGYDALNGHLPPMFFAGPHPARFILPTFKSSTTVVKLDPKQKKKQSRKVDFTSLVNDFFVNSSMSKAGLNEEASDVFSVTQSSSHVDVEAIDVQAAVQHERSAAQMISSDRRVTAICMGVVDMKNNNVYILFSNEKVFQLPGKERVNFTKQLETSRQSSLGLPGGQSNAQLASSIVPNYSDDSCFCFYKTMLYFVPLGSRLLYCFDFLYDRLFTTVQTVTSSSSSLSHLSSITCIDAADVFVVSGSKDTSVIAWKKDHNGISPFKLLLAHAKAVAIVKVVKKFKLLLSVDMNGTICLSMFPFLKLVKKIEVGFVPRFVDMTRCCIVAMDGSRAASFTSNGERIAERTFAGFSVVCEVAVDVVSRSDVVLIATSNRELLLLNCVSLEIVGVLIKLDALVKLLRFDEKSGTVAIVTEANEVIFTQIPD